MTFNFYNEQDVAYIKKAFAGRTIGLTSGAFDMYHVLHDDYLQRCRRHCGHDGVLIVGVDSNDLLSERKGPKRPIIPETDRLQLVSGRNGVDAAFVLGTVQDFGLAAKILGVKYIFKNQDYKPEEVLGADVPGVKLVIIQDCTRLSSTTETIDRIIRIHTEVVTGEKESAV